MLMFSFVNEGALGHIKTLAHMMMNKNMLIRLGEFN